MNDKWILNLKTIMVYKFSTVIKVIKTKSNYIMNNFKSKL